MVQYNRGTKKVRSQRTNSSDIGYGKPPKEHRFAKGKSGNPSGRPKKVKTLGSLLGAELKNRVTINEGKGPRRVSKWQALTKQLVNNAVRGDLPSAKVIIDLFRNPSSETDPAADAAASEERRKNFMVFVRILEEKQKIKLAAKTKMD